MKLITILLCGGMLLGCATTKDLEAVRAEAKRAQEMATVAQLKADSSAACCIANQEAMNKAFKRSQYK